MLFCRFFATLSAGRPRLGAYVFASAPSSLCFAPVWALSSKRAVLHTERGEFTQAIELFEESLRIHDDALVRSEMAVALQAAGRTPEAVEQLVRAVRMNPKDYMAWNNLGFLRETSLRDLEGAREAYERAIRLNPVLPESHFNLGRVCATLGKRDQALAHLRRFLELVPPNVPVRKVAQEMIDRLSDGED